VGMEQGEILAKYAERGVTSFFLTNGGEKWAPRKCITRIESASGPENQKVTGINFEEENVANPKEKNGTPRKQTDEIQWVGGVGLGETNFSKSAKDRFEIAVHRKKKHSIAFKNKGMLRWEQDTRKKVQLHTLQDGSHSPEEDCQDSRKGYSIKTGHPSLSKKRVA